MPPSAEAQAKKNPFTKRCTTAGVETLEPDDEWFTERGAKAPRGAAARKEVFACHAFVYASCDLADEAAVVAAFHLLTIQEQAFLLANCKHPYSKTG